MTKYAIEQPEAPKSDTDIVTFKLEMHTDCVTPIWCAKQNGDWVRLAHATKEGRMFFYGPSQEKLSSLPGLRFNGDGQWELS